MAQATLQTHARPAALSPPRRMALAGAEVTVLDRSLPRLRQLDELFQGRLRTRYSSVATIEEEVFAAVTCGWPTRAPILRNLVRSGRWCPPPTRVAANLRPGCSKARISCA